MRSAGARYAARRCAAAASRSATLEEKLVLANSPSLEPRPVKSKRRQAMPRVASCCAMRVAAKTSLPQVKQCAKSAYADADSSGASRRAASCWPPLPAKATRSVFKERVSLGPLAEELAELRFVLGVVLREARIQRMAVRRGSRLLGLDVG